MRDGSRKWWRTAAGLLAWALWSAAAAQEFPVRPVRVIVGAGPGSVPDSVARLLAEALTAEIATEVMTTAQPKDVTVTLTQRPRGGIEVAAVARRSR
jgi:hypothetical protein